MGKIGTRLYDVLKNEALSGGSAAEYTGAHQDTVDGSGMKAIYYYYATTNAEGTYYASSVYGVSPAFRLG